MPTLWTDLRFAFRMLAKRPGFTTLAVLALALGIGANTAVFSVIRGTILRPLPYADPSRLVAIWESNLQANVAREPSSPPNLQDWSDRNRCFTAMAGYVLGDSPLTGSGDAEMIDTGFVTANYFELLGVNPALGRIIRSSDKESEVVLLSSELWTRRFGRDPDILGRQLRLGGTLRTVLGVMPAHFRHADFIHSGNAELWIPLNSANLPPQRRSDFLRVIARMKPGVSIVQAQAEMTSVSARLKQEYPAENSSWTIELRPLDEAISGFATRPLWLLFASAAVLLLIACANVANLSLSRSTERRREFAIRAALGGGASRLFRQLITESLVLGLLGGAAGFLLGNWTTRAMLALGGSSIPRTSEVRLDLSVMLFALVISCATAMLFGVLPARQASRANLNDSLKAGRKQARAALVIAEVALSLLLVAECGLLLRSFWQLESVDLGFEPSRLLTARVALLSPNTANFLNELVQRIERLPGVTSASASAGAPLTAAGHNAFLIDGHPAAPDAMQDAILDPVTPGYFRTMNIALRSGRYLTPSDTAVVISETLARRYFPNESPLGHRLSWDAQSQSTIVGVVADVHQRDMAAPPVPQIYVPHALLPATRMVLEVRSSVDPLSLTSAVRAELRAMNQTLPLYDIHTEQDLIAANVAPRRFALTLITLLAGLALLIASIGIYGVMSYSVTESTRELGIRMALGAPQSSVLEMVLARGLKLVAIGIAIGAIAFLAASRILASFLFNISPYDPITFVSVAAIFMTVALAACMIPALRATTVDPTVALHYD